MDKQVVAELKRSPHHRRRSSLKGNTKDKLAAKLRLLFDEADHDGGGTVSSAEMMTLLREHGERLSQIVPVLKGMDFASDVCSDALFKRFDVDSDGELDKAEFVDGFVYEARARPLAHPRRARGTQAPTHQWHVLPSPPLPPLPRFSPLPTLGPLFPPCLASLPSAHPAGRALAVSLMRGLPVLERARVHGPASTARRQ